MNTKLKHRLDYHYKAFDKTQISPDPLQFLHLFNDYKNIEAMGFIASVFAYGNVKQIVNTLDKIVAASGNNPYGFITGFSKNHSQKLKGIKHRFYTEEDITTFFYTLGKIYKKHGSLKNLFLKFYKEDDPNLKSAINEFSKYFISSIENEEGHLSAGTRFMFPLPALGSACKRINLFLRWMVRKDDLDFGLWSDIPTSKLIIPVDTHVARVCQALGLTKTKNVSWKMAEEITGNLAMFDPIDPVKYDFAICHIGMRKIPF